MSLLGDFALRIVPDCGHFHVAICLLHGDHLTEFVLVLPVEVGAIDVARLVAGGGVQQRSSSDEILWAWAALAILASGTTELEVVAARIVQVVLLLLPLFVPQLWVALHVAVPIAAFDQLNLSCSLCKNFSLLSELTLEACSIPRLLHQFLRQHVGIALAAPVSGAAKLDVVQLGILKTLLWVLCLPLLVLQGWEALQVAVPVAALAHLSNGHLSLGSNLGLLRLTGNQNLASVLRKGLAHAGSRKLHGTSGGEQRSGGQGAQHGE